jgi:hypothetical protein
MGKKSKKKAKGKKSESGKKGKKRAGDKSPKPLKKKCCLKYKKKGKACKRCPVMAKLTPERREALLEKYAPK